jgi:hypothetical protein
MDRQAIQRLTNQVLVLVQFRVAMAWQHLSMCVDVDAL